MVNPQTDFSLDRLPAYGPVIPVIVLDDVRSAVPMARALVAGGVRVLEITLRTPAALESMRRIAAEVPEAIVGAGTLRSAADVEAAKAAGCQFGVSPGWTAGLDAACRSMDLPLLPGVSTASELMQAADAGRRFLKFFPAVAAGGIPMLKALAGPFPDIRFCPTGGLTVESAPGFLSLPNVVVCGGSWLTPADAMARGDWSLITRLAQACAALRPHPSQ